MEQNPLLRIGETMKNLEVFQYAAALYLNMGYYTMRIFTRKSGQDDDSYQIW